MAILGAWTIGAGFLLPKLITDIYAGESWPLLNRLIEVRNARPIDFYLSKSNYLYYAVIAFLAGVVLPWVLLRPACRRPSVLVEAWRDYWFRPDSGVFLAITRIVAAGLATAILVTAGFGRSGRIQDLVYLPDALYQPLLLNRVFLAGWGGDRPSEIAILWIFWTSVGVGILATIGLWTRFCLPVFAAGYSVLIGYFYSFRDLHHPEPLMAIALWAMAFSPAGDRVSVDAFFGRQQAHGSRADRTENMYFRAWPLLLVQAMYAIVYLDSGIQKLLHSGLGWMNGSTLQYYLLRDGVLRGSELAGWMAQQGPLLLALSILTIWFETTFWLVLVRPKLVWFYVPLGFCFHLGNSITHIADFYEMMALYVVFLPQFLGHWKQSPFSVLNEAGRRAELRETPDASRGIPESQTV